MLDLLWRANCVCERTRIATMCFLASTVAVRYITITEPNATRYSLIANKGLDKILLQYRICISQRPHSFSDTHTHGHSLTRHTSKQDSNSTTTLNARDKAVVHLQDLAALVKSTIHCTIRRVLDVFYSECQRPEIGTN